MHPKNVDALAGKGKVLTSLGKYEEALGCFAQALTIDAGCWKTYEAKGYTLNRMRKHQEAVFAFENAITKNRKNDPISYLGRAEAFLCLKNFELGRKDTDYAQLATK